MNDTLNRLKESCARVVGERSRGTGYVVTPKHIATCEHVVQRWQEGRKYEVFIGTDQIHRAAWLVKRDASKDVAILEFENGLDVEPLKLVTSINRRAVFEGYGYPQLAKEAGIPFDGEVLDPIAKDQDGRPAVQLFSRMFASGQASPLHGFSGSPVIVDGCVIGHLTRHLGDPDDRRRGALGIVYACLAEEVRALLEQTGIELETQAITAPAPVTTSLKEHIPTIAEGEYHVFVSYRSTDRAKAKYLVGRLEGAGYRVFMDQNELQPGQYLAGQLESGIARSRSGIVLVSRDWLASDWCQQEANYLVKRAVENNTFQLVPIRLDNCEMPGFLDSRVWLDFNGMSFDDLSWTDTSGVAERSETASRIDQLLWAVIGKTPPGVETIAGRLASAETDATQNFLARIRAASRTTAVRVYEVWEEWRVANLADATPALIAAQTLIEQGEPKKAISVLEASNATGIRAQQLLGLALGKDRQSDKAIEILEVLNETKDLDPETAGILAGRYRQRWLASGNIADLQRSADLYHDAWEKTGDTYNGINAASNALYRGNKREAQKIAAQVQQKLERKGEDNYEHWDWATAGEVSLIWEDMDEARRYYNKAIGLSTGKHENIATMRRFVRLDLEHLGRDRHELDNVFPVPNVIAFFGHMTDVPDRDSPRFPESRVGAVRQQIRARLAQIKGPLLGISTAARGSDMIFLDELIQRGGHARLLLPFPKEAFLEVSVGGHWNRRFDELYENASVEVEVLTDQLPQADELSATFELSNLEVQKRTLDYARLLDETPIVLAVWDGKPGDGTGGTADAIELWRADGFDPEIIEP